MEDEPPYFVVGTRSHYGWGMCATDIEPVDEATMDQVSTDCFDGQATPAEPDHVLVFHSGNAEDSFEQVAPGQWIIGRDAPEEIIELETLMIEMLRWDGATWVVVGTWDGCEWT